MARTPMVTRTIITTMANVLCLNIEQGEPFNKVVEVPRTYKTEEELLNKVKSVADTDTEKCVHIVAKEEIETLYGMTEQEFIEHATVLPPRGEKTDDATTDTTTE